MIASYSIAAQIAINTDGSNPDNSAGLHVNFTDKGFLPPRMTAVQRDAISNPATSLIIYCTDCYELQMYNGTHWVGITVKPASTCGDILVDTRDSQTYATVQIGSQCWMAENLNIGTFIDGSNNQTNNSIIEKYCYSNDTNNCNTYGGLYQWDEMMKYSNTSGTQGICPNGFHLPTDSEWMALEEEVESTSSVNWSATGFRGTDVGGNLKETTFTHWSSPNTGATNSSGFTSRPSGNRGTSGSFGMQMFNTSFWSSDENGSDAWIRLIYWNMSLAGRFTNTKEDGSSVRCIRN